MLEFSLFRTAKSSVSKQRSKTAIQKDVGKLFQILVRDIGGGEWFGIGNCVSIFQEKFFFVFGKNQDAVEEICAKSVDLFNFSRFQEKVLIYLINFS